MTRGIKWATAIALVVAGLGAGLYQQSSLLQMFSAFGLDIAASNNEFLKNSRGEDFFLFPVVTEDGESVTGRWQRHLPARLGNTPGSIWVNGQAFMFDRDGNVTGDTAHSEGLEVYALEREVRAWVTTPLVFNVSAADSLWTMSGNVWLDFDDCEPDSVTVIPSRPRPNYPYQAFYRVLIEEADSLGVYKAKFNDIADTETHSYYSMNPGSYRVWFAMIDGLGMEGHYIGPLHILAGDCP